MMWRRIGMAGWLQAAACVAAVLAGCQTDSYDKGQGAYSLMQADLCEMSVDGEKRATHFVTDDGEGYDFTVPVAAKWIATADTTYRTLIYYNKVGDGRAQAVALTAIVTMHPVAYWRFTELPQDPIGFESAWISGSGRYLNVGLLMKTGRIDGEELPHNVGLAQDTLYVRADGRRTALYRLLHSQNGIPEYYTNRRYVSIRLPEPAPDTIRLSIRTYEGDIERTLLKK